MRRFRRLRAVCAFGQRRRHQIADAGCAGRIAKDRDAFRIAAEGCDIPLHPLKRGGLIKERLVGSAAAIGFASKVGMREESEDPQTIVDGDQHHALLGQRFPVGRRRRAGSAGIAARMQPHHHRTFVVGRYSGGPR